MQIKEDIIDITKEEWEMIRDSFDIDFRVVDENRNPLPESEVDTDLIRMGDFQEISDKIKKWDFRAGTNPLTFIFEFDNGEKIYCAFYVEEFGGVVEWSFESDYDAQSEFMLEERTEWDVYNKHTGEIDIKYVCLFNII